MSYNTFGIAQPCKIDANPDVDGGFLVLTHQLLSSTLSSVIVKIMSETVMKLSSKGMLLIYIKIFSSHFDPTSPEILKYVFNTSPK